MSTKTVSEKQFYSVKDLAAMGVASESTLWRRIKDGDLRAIKCGRSVRVSAEALEDYEQRHSSEYADVADILRSDKSGYDILKDCVVRFRGELSGDERMSLISLMASGE